LISARIKETILAKMTINQGLRRTGKKLETSISDYPRLCEEEKNKNHHKR
jgi:hypothetical protein